MPLSITWPAVTPPRRRTDLLTRPRLLDLLYEILERKLLLVVAPAGYGKTSLLIDFVHQENISACWYTVDRHDAELARFLAHFVAAIARVYPEFGPRSNAAIESLEKFGCQIEPVITGIVNDLYEHVDQHFVLVLDDFHQVAGNSEIASFLSRFVTRVDENCHLIIASRHELALPEIELLTARGLAGCVHRNDLAFLPSEVQLLPAARKQALTIEQANELAGRMEGWITGILLAASSGPLAANKFQPGSYASSKSLAAYWDLLLTDQPNPVQDFLLISSLLDEFNAGLCEAVLHPLLDDQNPNWNELCALALKNNLFITSAGEDGGWLRYHSLFRDYLTRRLNQKYPHAPEIILRRLAAVYQDRQDWERAVAACQQLKDHQLLADTIERAGPALLKFGRFQTLKKWLDAVPAALLRSHPGMLSLQGSLALMESRTLQSLTFFNQADALLRSSGDQPRLVRNLVRRSTAHYFSSDFPSALHDAEQALEFIGEDDALLALKAQALKNRGISLRSMGRNDEGILDLERSLEIYQSLEDNPGAAELSVELAITLQNMGDLPAAQAAYSQAEVFWRQEGNYYRLADLLNSQGILYQQTGEYERAVESFQEGLKCARAVGYARLEAFLLASLGDLYSEIQSPEDAQHVYEDALDIAYQLEIRFLLFYLNYALARLSRTAGEFDQALCLLQTAAGHAPSSYEQALFEMETGRIAAVRTETELAIPFLESALLNFQQGKFFAEETQVLLYLSAAYLSTGQEEKALKCLRSAFDKTPHIKESHSLVVAGRDALPVIKLAAVNPSLKRQARILLENICQFEANLPSLRRKLRTHAAQTSPCQPKLIIQAFGEARVNVHGKSIGNSDWKSQTQKDILFYLLQNPSGVTKETLLSLFWPDSDPRGTQLSNLLYKLRRLLGIDTVRHHDGRYSFNRALDYEYDVEVFTEAATRAKKTEDLNEQIRAYEQMIDTYHGQYLPEANSSWVVPYREYLRQEYQNAVTRLIEIHLNQGHYQAGLDRYWQAIHLDPCCEDFYCLGMRIYARMGNRSNVVYQYQLCQQALAKTLGIEPSKEIQRLYRQLIN